MTMLTIPGGNQIVLRRQYFESFNFCLVIHYSLGVNGGYTFVFFMMGLTFEGKFPRETWTLYGFGILVILIRL